jgi:ketosteroid isomerase-like protein
MSAGVHLARGLHESLHEEAVLVELADRRVMVSFRANFRGAGSGAEASMPVWNLITLDGDRIVRFEEFADEQSALAAVRGER